MNRTGAVSSVTVTVELFGMARVKTGVSHVRLAVDPQAPVATLVRDLSDRCPVLIGNALCQSVDGSIVVAEGYALNRNGLAFLSPDDQDQPRWADGDSLLLLSNQAGG